MCSNRWDSLSAFRRWSILDRSWWWAAAPPAEVAEDLNRHLRDPQVRAISSLTGGRMTLSYLDLIDVEAVRADPKPVLGMSDISVLHLRSMPDGLGPLHSDLVTFGFGEWNEVDDAAATSSQTCTDAS